MPSRRATVLVALSLLVAGALTWRAAQLRESSPAPALARTLDDLAQRVSNPVAFLSEDERVDGFLRERGVGSSIVPRGPDAIEQAVQRGTLVAGPRGRAYLEMLGYELSRLPQQSDAAPFRLARVERRLRCTGVGGEAWSPLPGLEYTGRLGVILPSSPAGAIVVVIGDQLPLDPEVTSGDGSAVSMEREVLPSVAAAPPDYWLEGRSPLDAPAEIQRLTIFAAADRSWVLSVRLGRRAPRVLARLRGYPRGVRASICAAPVGPDVAFAHDKDEFVLSTAQAPYFGYGWSDELEAGAGPVRWMAEHGALLIPFARRGSLRVALLGYRDLPRGDARIALRINDAVDTPALPIVSGPQKYEWTVPESAWVVGTNEMLVRVSGSGDERLLGLQRLQLTLVH